MFHKLRVQFVLTNLAIIAAIWLLLLIGACIFVRSETKRHPFNIMNHFSELVCTGKLIDLPASGNHDMPPAPFFVKTDAKGIPNFTSSSNPLTATQTSKLIHKIRDSHNGKGSVNFANSDYIFINQSIPDSSESLFVFLDTKPEKAGMLMLLLTFSAIGFVCIAISLVGSLFMARKAIAPIKQAWQQQSDFLADAAHELRTPISIMRINLDVLLANPEETVGAQKQWLGNIHEEVKQMSKMLESLFFLAHADSNQQPLERSKFNLGISVADAIHPYELVARAENISLKKNLALDIFMLGDEFKLKQVVNILLDNAIRHTKAGGRIIIDLSASHRQICLEVTNEGDGIPEKNLENIFKRFFQIDEFRAKGKAGLGLSIAKWIVEAHSGKIKATSHIGKSMTFSITLPYG